MTAVINIANKIVLFLDLQLMKAIGRIDLDYGLIRYLLKILSTYIISTDKYNYLHIENRDKGTTLVHRIILEYYAQYDDKLKKSLTNGNLEINHKNKRTWDNRLENLEIVTKSDNLKHKYNQIYDAYISSDYLIEIQARLKNNKKYNTDRRYLNIVSRENDNMLYNGLFSKEKLFKNLYFKFNSITKQFNKNTQNSINQYTLEDFNTTFFSYNKSNIFNKYLNYSEITYNTYQYKNIINSLLIKPLIYYYHKYIIFNIIKNNINLLFKYKNNNLDLILKKHNIINLNYIPNPNKWTDLYINHNLLINLYRILLHGNLHFTIYKNKVLISIPVKDCFSTYKVNTSFSTLFYLELLTNISADNKKYSNYLKYKSHDCSHFTLDKFTPDLIKQANKKAKLMLEQELTKSSHYIIQQNFGEEEANRVYTRQVSKNNTKRALKTTQDIHNIIKSKIDYINKYGYLTVAEIFEELYYLNITRKANCEAYNEIYKNCDKFIRLTLSNIPETKILLKDLNLTYKTLNNKTIESIIKYQEKNNNIRRKDLDCYKKVIMLKKLYRGGKSNGKSLHHKRSSTKTT